MILLAELGRFPVRMHFWQQMLCYHDRAVQLPDHHLVKLALLDEFCDFSSGMPRTEALTDN